MWGQFDLNFFLLHSLSCAHVIQCTIVVWAWTTALPLFLPVSLWLLALPSHQPPVPPMGRLSLASRLCAALPPSWCALFLIPLHSLHLVQCSDRTLLLREAILATASVAPRSSIPSLQTLLISEIILLINMLICLLCVSSSPVLPLCKFHWGKRFYFHRYRHIVSSKIIWLEQMNWT